MVKKAKDKEITNEETLNEKDLKLKYFKDDINKYVKERVDAESKSKFNINDYKKEIDSYIKERVEVESASQSVKLLKKQLKSKKISSAIKSFIILALLACIGSGIYYLYNDGYFDDNKNNEAECNCKSAKNQDIDNKNNEDKEPDTKKEISLDELVKEYGYLLDNVTFDANSNYTSDYYNGNLTDEIKEYLAYKLINKDEIISEEDSSYIDSSSLKNAYSKLFDDEIVFKNFKYNNASYIYLEPKNMFIANTKPNEEKIITREIIAVEVDEDKDEVTITCVEGYVSDKNKLYNIVNNKEVSGFKTSDALSKYKNKLNVIKYVFNNDYLVDIEK
jgi:hypothetical protein